MALASHRLNVCHQSRLLQVTAVRLPFRKAPQALVRPSTFVCRSAAVDQPTTEPVPAVETPPSEADTTTAAPVAAKVSSNKDDSKPRIIKVGKDTHTIKAARYIADTLTTLPAGQTLLMRAIGAKSTAQAMRTIARASELLSNTDSSSIITFQPTRRPFSVNTERGTASATDFYITKSSASAYTPDIPEGQYPMHVRSTTGTAKVVSHIKYAADNLKDQQRSQPTAQFVLRGTTGSMIIAIAGMISTRFELRDGQKQDITVTVSRVLQEASEQPQQQEQQQQQEDASITEATAAAPAEADESEGNESAENNRGLSYVYTFNVYLCDPRPSSSRRRPERSTAKRADTAKTSSGAASPKPGMIEVPESEWSQLKEQLEMVPHLTEQLQVMTQQHEQLLSLLAAQQPSQQGPEQGHGQQQQ